MRKILVDADACPVKEIIVKHAKRMKIPVIMLIDTSHVLSDGYSEIITVDKARDSVDLALINRTSCDDIVITQDYGLATMVLAKKAKALNQNGLIYTNNNIDGLLFDRHIGQKIRASGGRMTSIKKRTKEDDAKFEKVFLSLLGE